jgi:hypothetical protein
MKAIRSTTFFLVCAVLTTACCLFSIAKRVSVENRNNEYAIAADSDAIESLAAAEGLTLEEAIPKLKTSGLNAIILQEQTVGELIGEGKMELTGFSLTQPGQPVAGGEKAQPQSMKTLTFADDATVARVVRGLTIRFGKLVNNTQARDRKLALPPVDAASIRGTAVGLDPRIAELAKKNGLTIIARCSNPVGITSKAVTETLTWANQLGATIFLAQGEQVLGRRDALETTSNTLGQLKMLYASPEFAKLGGDIDMLNAMSQSVVRLHSAQAAELDKLSPAAAIERYRKAAKERNMRVLLVRPLSNSSESPLGSLGEFMASIQSSLTQEGLTLGTPVPYTDPGVSKVFRILIGLFGALSAAWVAMKLVPGQNGMFAAGAGAFIILAGSATSGMGLRICALLLSAVFPIASYYWMRAAKAPPALAFVGMTAISMVGGLCVAGLLNGIDYYIRAEAFFGVKFAVFFPIFLVGIVCFAQFNDLKTSMKEPITWGAAATGLVILAALGLMVLRTGNDNPNAVSGGELAFRGLLEQLLPVRPRTKDFLIGFPALLVGLMLLNKAGYNPSRLGKLSGWTSLLIMLGGIGLTDVVNTLCHLHTPVITSVIRNIEGILLGFLVGIAIWFLVKGPLSKFILPEEAPTEPIVG